MSQIQKLIENFLKHVKWANLCNSISLNNSAAPHEEEQTLLPKTIKGCWNIFMSAKVFYVTFIEINCFLQKDIWRKCFEIASV